MSLTPQEQRIMDLWDAGLSIGRIAYETQLRLKTVQNTVFYYGPMNDQRLSDESLRRGSQELADAISRHLNQ